MADDLPNHPRLLQTVLDTTDPRRLAEFYRELLGYRYRAGDEPPTDGTPDEPDWLVLTDGSGGSHGLAFQLVDELPPTNWPEPPGIPQQLHLDMGVPDVDELARQRSRALDLGASERLDRSADEEEPLYVFADPAGHPFCIFVD
jgi:catechol 2,3-dioxygenase-like lactoylglutathione lyase family enzyme